MSGPRIRRLGADDWELLRAIRFEALRESPAAFGSTFERELAFDEGLWRSRLETSAYFVAEAGTGVIGMACAYRHGEADNDASPSMELVSMWVAPDHRHQGVAVGLVNTVLDYARAEGESLLGLWVAAGNEAAAALYRRIGFQPTGEAQGMPGRPAECEIRMTISL